MTTKMQSRAKAAITPISSFTPVCSGLLQRKCACGGMPGPTGECEECHKKKRLGLQTKLKVNEPGDIYEQEADRIADQVMATAAHAGVSGPPPRIQRFSGQPSGQMDAAPASVDQALASPGKRLDPAVRHDMEERFGHDFSRVRVHFGGAAEKSARDVNAHAYTVGHDIVFGAGGRQGVNWLTAHELAHVTQSRLAAEPTVIRRAPGDGPGGGANDFKIVSDVWEVNGRKVVVVESGGERITFYERSSSDLKGRLPGHVGPERVISHRSTASITVVSIRTSSTLENSRAIPDTDMGTRRTFESRSGWTRRVCRGRFRHTGNRCRIAWRSLGLRASPRGDLRRQRNPREIGKWDNRRGWANPWRRTEDVLVAETKTASKAGRFATRLARVGEIAGPVLDAFLMLLSYRDVDIDASALPRLSKEKLQPILDKELSARSAEIAKVGAGLDAFWGGYANVNCELHYKFVPDAKGQSLGKLQLYDVRFLGLKITAQDVSKAEWDKEAGRKAGEGIQQATLSVLVYMPPHQRPTMFPEQPEPTDPLYFSSSAQRSPLGPQPVTTDELLSWARRNYPRRIRRPEVGAKYLVFERVCWLPTGAREGP